MQEAGHDNTDCNGHLLPQQRSLGFITGVRLKGVGTQTERERKWLYSSLPALGQAVRDIYKYARCKAMC